MRTSPGLRFEHSRFDYPTPKPCDRAPGGIAPQLVLLKCDPLCNDDVTIFEILVERETVHYGFEIDSLFIMHPAVQVRENEGIVQRRFVKL